MGSAEPTTRSRAARRRKLAHLVLLGLFVVLLALWLTTGYRVPGAIDKDWVSFDTAGWRALSLDWRSVYTDSAGTRWPYLYPPFTIFLTMPLGMLPYYPSYLVAVGSALVAILWSLGRLLDGVGSGDGRRALFVSAALLSPTAVQTLVTGQYSWIYLAAVSGAYACWRSGDDRRAGYALALLLVKPNIAIFFLPFLVARRCGRTLRGAGWAAVVLLACSLPFGVGPWVAFIDNVRGVAARQQAGDAPIAKQVTAQSFVRVLLGPGAWSTTVSWVVWGAVTVGLGAVCWRLWRRPGRMPLLRLVGTACLLAVAANPRLYFYDALLLLVPAAGWYLEAGSYASAARRRSIGVALAAMVAATIGFFWFPAAGTAVGPCCVLWLLVESSDAAAERAGKQVAAPDAVLLEAA